MATLQEAREVWKHISDYDFDNMLWTCTPYPCRCVEEACDYLILLHPKLDGDVQAAIKVSSDEFDRVWAKHKELEKNRQASLGTESNNS